MNSARTAKNARSAAIGATQAEYVANQLADSFWKSSAMEDTVIGVRLYNDVPLTNFDFPYQLLFTFYSHSYGLYANTTQDNGGVAKNGIISYEYGSWRGKMTDANTIMWEGGLPTSKQYHPNPIGRLDQQVVWKRVVPPPNTQGDQYSGANILQQARQLTTRYDNEISKAYPAVYSDIRL